MSRNRCWVVAKFGGTSVSSLESINCIVNILKNYKRNEQHVLMVVSALSGVSNLLENIVNYPDEVDIESAVNELTEKHFDLIKSLEIKDKDLESFLKDKMLWLTEKHTRLLKEEYKSFYSIQAEIMALGELLSSRILRVYLEDQLNTLVAITDAREWLTSDNQSHRSIADRYLNAECSVAFDAEKERQLSRLSHLIITQGFIAANTCGETVVLGRGGSDTSAACLATLVGANRLDIWTDVPGMFSANPRYIPESRQLLQLDYREAQEIASTGAKVLHPRCIRPARNAGIPIFLGSTFNPELGGTLIANIEQKEPQVKAISVRRGVLIIAMETSDMWQTPGFLAEAFGIFYKHGLSIDQISTSETNVTVTLDNLTQEISSSRIKVLVDELGAICRVRVTENCSAVSIVGRSIRMLLAKLSNAFDAFQNRSVHMLTQAANNLNFTFVIDENEADQLVKQLHDSLITEYDGQAQIGPSWNELFYRIDSENPEHQKEHWWHKSISELETLALTQSPCFVYSETQIQNQINKLQSVSSIDRLFYAMKANSHPKVLKIVESYGLGFECVSINEVKFVLQEFPLIARNRIIFTPNFAPRYEYVEALALGIHLTLDNLYPLENWPELFVDKSVLLRIDTGLGRGHHRHVKTAGKEAKFGIPIDVMMQHLDLINQLNINVVGLHCHVGSGVLSAENWAENGQVLKGLVEYFPDIKYLDLGGGLGIVEKPGQNPLSLNRVNELLSELKSRLGRIEIWLEPGRFIVAESGVLLAKVTQLKGKSDAGYLGIETGMNSLIRPSLYGAYHPIFNISRISQPAKHKYTVVGPICESADKLGVDRLLPESFEGDVILIANSGAYGRVMSSSYNMREPAKEVMY